MQALHIRPGNRFIKTLLIVQLLSGNKLLVVIRGMGLILYDMTEKQMDFI